MRCRFTDQPQVSRRCIVRDATRHEACCVIALTPYIVCIGNLLSDRSRLQSAIASAFPDIRAVHIDRSAQPPQSPIKPRRTLILALAIVLGGMLGVFVALIVNAVQARRTLVGSDSGGA